MPPFEPEDTPLEMPLDERPLELLTLLEEPEVVPDELDEADELFGAVPDGLVELDEAAGLLVAGLAEFEELEAPLDGLFDSVPEKTLEPAEPEFDGAAVLEPAWFPELAAPNEPVRVDVVGAGVLFAGAGAVLFASLPAAAAGGELAAELFVPAGGTGTGFAAVAAAPTAAAAAPIAAPANAPPISPEETEELRP